MKRLNCTILLFISSVLLLHAQKKGTEQWAKISDDEIVTIYYNTKITTDKSGNHIVWVKAVYHDLEWQRYFSNQIGSRTLVTTTKTKAMFSDRYTHVMVRQVMCYSKSGKLLYNSGDDTSAGWGIVNAADPVGIVGEFFIDKCNNMY